ncbi:FadR family transcriptional regulator [Treponema sp. TIM-1]|uniref:FadR/GntR family transcriptional regulator n=1 Tax=Treponema sp. TIM-1 TaxID=2898417 RepID=UPI0039807119
MSEAASQYTFNNLKRSSTVERIVENLITLVRERSLNIGDKLPPERQLCEMIGVSRPSLREALKALQVMNIIDIRQGAGAYIKSLEPEDVVEHLDIVFHLDSSLYHDLYEARRVIEASIAAMAAEKINDDELEFIEENIRQAAGDIDNEQAFAERDLELHHVIMKAAGNRVIPVFMQSINKLALLIRQKTNAMPNIRKNTIKDHRAILMALKNHDPQESAAAMERHIRNVERAFFYENREVEQ